MNKEHQTMLFKVYVWIIALAGVFIVVNLYHSTPTPKNTGITNFQRTASSSVSIWQPKLSDTFNMQLQGEVINDIFASVYVVDLFDTPSSKISEIKKSGRHVVCYFSAGSAENWRDDYIKILVDEKGKAVGSWSGENWLDIRSANVRNVMMSRLDLAASKGCDAADPDNVEEYTIDSGFPITMQDQLDYNLFLAAQAHARGLAISLKNDGDQVKDLVSVYDFSINESCHEFSECGDYEPFIKIKKPVVNIEYADNYVKNSNHDFNKLCVSAHEDSFRTLVLPKLLDGSFRYSCD